MARQRIWVRSGGSIKTMIESFESLTWTRRFRTLGSLQMRVNRNVDGAQFLVDALGDEISITDDPTSTEPDMTFVIESLTLMGGDGAVGDVVEVMAIEAGLFHMRVALPPPHELPLSGTESHHEIIGDAETAMREIVDNNCGPSAPADRQFPNLVLAANQNRGVSRTWQARFETVVDKLKTWSEISELGWEVQFDAATNQHVFTVLEGTDNSLKVQFSIALNNVQTQEWVRAGQDQASLAYVAGQGEGVARAVDKTFDVTEPTNNARREIFVDARDLDDAADLPGRGNEKLAERRIDETLDAEISPISPFIYKRDWDLGDIVTLSSETWDISKAKRIVEIEARLNPNDGMTRRRLVFGKAPKQLSVRIRDLFGDQATARQ